MQMSNNRQVLIHLAVGLTEPKDLVDSKDSMITLDKVVNLVRLHLVMYLKNSRNFSQVEEEVERQHSKQQKEKTLL
jgi:hypothetical protein